MKEGKYRTLNALRRGEVVNIAGISLRMDDGEIKPGDLYVAERNICPELLTAKKVDLEIGCVFPTCNAYAYDLHECVKVREA